MSTRDARLSQQERAALANLEAAAVADDPQFAARLRGSALFRVKAGVPRLAAMLVGYWRALLRNGWWGAPIAVLGLGLMILGMSNSIWLSIAGAGLAAFGLRLVAQAADDVWRRKRSEPS
jgi:hypothetical protein